MYSDKLWRLQPPVTIISILISDKRVDTYKWLEKAIQDGVYWEVLDHLLDEENIRKRLTEWEVVELDEKIEELRWGDFWEVELADSRLEKLRHNQKWVKSCTRLLQKLQFLDHEKMAQTTTPAQTDTTLFETIGVKGREQSDPRGPTIRVFPYTYYPKGASPTTPPTYRGINTDITISPATVYVFARNYMEILIGGVLVTRIFPDILPQVAEGYSCITHVIPGFPDRRAFIEDTTKSITYRFDYSSLKNASDPTEPYTSTANALIVTSPSTGKTASPSNSDTQPVPDGTTPTPTLQTKKSILKLQGKCYLSCNNEDFSPTIEISSLTAARNQNFGEMFATVTNDVKYDDTYNGINTEIAPGVWESQFCEFPQFNKVLKGKGYTLEQKFLSIIDHYNLTTTLDMFTAQMALYAYTRYVLSRFLFGNFDVCYLTRQYTKEFFRRLADSEFSQFLVVFGPMYGLEGFDKYFHRKCYC